MDFFFPYEDNWKIFESGLQSTPIHVKFLTSITVLWLCKERPIRRKDTDILKF